jgi:hypothetical protein
MDHYNEFARKPRAGPPLFRKNQVKTIVVVIISAPWLITTAIPAVKGSLS